MEFKIDDPQYLTASLLYLAVAMYALNRFIHLPRPLARPLKFKMRAQKIKNPMNRRGDRR